jgi:hypothetical protein
LLRKVVDAEPDDSESPRSLVEQVTEIVDRHTRSQSNAA